MINRYKNEWKRKKRIFIAYAMRGLVLMVFICMLGLMICGCIFIYQLSHSKKVAVSVTENKVNYTQEAVTEESEDGNNDQKPLFGQNEETADLSGFVIVLDAGHGGKDSGTSSGNLYEKNVNMQMVEKLESKLKQTGATLVKTRSDDTYLSLAERVDVIRQTGADLFVSIHCNYYEDDASICGLECYYDKNSNEGKSYAESIASQIKESNTAETRGAKEENYYVTRESEVPAVLVEIGYLSNKEESSNLADNDYLERLSAVLAKGIIRQASHSK